MKTLWSKLDAFFFTPASPRPLAALRIGLAAILIVQAYLLRHDVLNFFAHDGLVQAGLAEHIADPNTPRINGVVSWLQGRGLSEAGALLLVARVYFAALLLLLVGCWTRPVAAFVWLLHWALASSGDCSAYGFDMYAHIFLFYLMVVPCGNAWSLDAARNLGLREPSAFARVSLRVMQLHLAIAYFASAIEKSTGIQWWNGELLWRALTLPEYRQFDMTWLANYPWITRVSGWGALSIEMFFIILIWPKRTRRLWVALTASMHLGIAVLLGLQIFGVIMCVLVISLFGFSAEPEREHLVAARAPALSYSPGV